MSEGLLTVLLGPLLLLQGQWVRWRTPRLPEPPGDRVGAIGNGEPFRLLVLGDSAAAGVGAAHQQDALSGQLIRQFEHRRQVHWRLEASTGATTRDTLAASSQLPPDDYDLVVFSLGVNDVTSRVSCTAWLVHYADLRNSIRARYPNAHLVISSLPPMHLFPALPQPLRWYLGRRARQFNCALESAVANEANASFLSLEFGTERELVASDGFHPGPKAYAIWARRIAEGFHVK